MKTTTSPRSRSQAEKTSRRSWKRFLPYLIGAAVVFLLFSALRTKPIEVETAAITEGPFTLSVLEEGKTRIRHRYMISPPVSGLLQRVTFRAGDKIVAGKTVLATISAEPSSFLNPRARAESEARLKATEAVKMQRQTQIERARDALDLAKKELARARELNKSGAIAARDWDAAQNRARMLERELRTAEFALQVAEFERAQAEATLLQAQNPAGELSEPMPILAPINGFVLNVHEENARIVTAGTPIMEVGDPSDLEVEVELLSSDAVGVQPGAEVSIEQWGGSTPLRGRVTVVEPGGFTKISALGVEEQRVKVRVEFVDPLPTGISFGDRYRVEARIITWQSDSVLQIPTGALFRHGGDWVTFLLDGKHARRTKIEIARNNGVAAEVRSGLRQSQRVVLHPPDTLSDGAAVRERGR